MSYLLVACPSAAAGEKIKCVLRCHGTGARGVHDGTLGLQEVVARWRQRVDLAFVISSKLTSV